MNFRQGLNPLLSLCKSLWKYYYAMMMVGKIFENEIDRILISQNLQPDKKNVEGKGLVQRWIELKLKRQDWKKELLGG